MGDFFKKAARFLLVSVIAGAIMWAVFKFALGHNMTIMHAAIGGVAANTFVSGANWGLKSAFGEKQPFVTVAVPASAPNAAANPGSALPGAPTSNVGSVQAAGLVG